MASTWLHSSLMDLLSCFDASFSCQILRSDNCAIRKPSIASTFRRIPSSGLSTMSPAWGMRPNLPRTYPAMVS